MFQLISNWDMSNLVGVRTLKTSNAIQHESWTKMNSN